jgi:hypothetical protein
VPGGNSSSVKIGNAVVALGNAEGQGSITATVGQVTGLNQTITSSEERSSTASETLSGMIQADADIVPGDSGGPLASSAGVIGMDAAGNGLLQAIDPQASFSDYLRPMIEKMILQEAKQEFSRVGDSTLDAIELGLELPERLDRILAHRRRPRSCRRENALAPTQIGRFVESRGIPPLRNRILPRSGRGLLDEGGCRSWTEISAATR